MIGILKGRGKRNVNANTYYIVHQSATGVDGYSLLHNQAEICVHGDVFAPGIYRKSARTFVTRTKKELITYPIPSNKHPTIVPGLKVRYDVLDGENGVDAVFEKAYGDSYYSKIVVYKGGEALFKYYPHTDALFFSMRNELIAFVEKDLTFKYDPCSTADKRYVFQMDEKYVEYLPYIFHMFISDKLGMLS